jgi:hypothetical protein
VTNDGVFANMSAKPESETNKEDETPPVRYFLATHALIQKLTDTKFPFLINQTYEQAATDATPPYWQTTIIAPAGMGDMVLVEGMPVGNIFAFAWNMISKFVNWLVALEIITACLYLYICFCSLYEFPICRLYVVLPTSHFPCRKGESTVV